jgi:hypothetical protein
VKLGETIFGVTVWAVLPGRQPGQQTELAHLTWGGPGEPVHLRGDGITDGHMEHYGRDLGPVSGACNTEAGAQQAIDEYFAGLRQGPASHALPDPLQPEATGAAGVPAAEPAEDETARILAEYGTPEKQLQYALWEADRLRRDAYQAAGKQLDADGSTAPARQRFDVAREAAHGRWAAAAATAVAWYAREIEATAPAASPAAGDADSPYNQGWGSGSHMLRADIVPRPGGYADGQWREYVGGVRRRRPVPRQGRHRVRGSAPRAGAAQPRGITFGGRCPQPRRARPGRARPGSGRQRQPGAAGTAELPPGTATRPGPRQRAGGCAVGGTRSLRKAAEAVTAAQFSRAGGRAPVVAGGADQPALAPAAGGRQPVAGTGHEGEPGPETSRTKRSTECQNKTIP